MPGAMDSGGGWFCPKVERKLKLDPLKKLRWTGRIIIEHMHMT